MPTNSQGSITFDASPGSGRGSLSVNCVDAGFGTSFRPTACVHWTGTQSDDFFEHGGVIPHSQRVPDRLQRRHDVSIATAAMGYPQALSQNTNG